MTIQLFSWRQFPHCHEQTHRLRQHCASHMVGDPREPTAHSRRQVQQTQLRRVAYHLDQSWQKSLRFRRSATEASRPSVSTSLKAKRLGQIPRARCRAKIKPPWSTQHKCFQIERGVDIDTKDEHENSVPTDEFGNSTPWHGLRKCPQSLSSAPRGRWRGGPGEMSQRCLPLQRIPLRREDICCAGVLVRQILLATYKIKSYITKKLKVSW